jgi:hypothetical protein
VWQGLEQTEQMRAAKQAAQQQMQAESLGMGNAAKPGDSPPPLPDRAGFNPDTNQSPVPDAVTLRRSARTLLRHALPPVPDQDGLERKGHALPPVPDQDGRGSPATHGAT